MVRRFFNLDLHISVIADVQDVLQRLYGDAVHVTNWSISGHNWVFKKRTPPVEVIRQETWRGLNERMIADFQRKYDDVLKTYDGFIVTHTPALALLYEKYGKPIVVVNSCRYEQPFCWNGDMHMWSLLNQSLKRMHDKGQLIAVSNNRSDMLYLAAGTEVWSTHIPSICLYTVAAHKPVRQELVVYGERGLFPASDKLVARPPSGYSWQDLYGYKAIVHVPYEMSTMSIFEQLSAGVPLFFPTKRFYAECIMNGKMNLISRYAQQTAPAALKDFFTSLDIWFNGADFYEQGDHFTFKFVYYYDSFEDMVVQAERFEETAEVQQARRTWLFERRLTVLAEWKKLLDPIVFPPPADLVPIEA